MPAPITRAVGLSMVVSLIPAFYHLSIICQYYMCKTLTKYQISIKSGYSGKPRSTYASTNQLGKPASRPCGAHAACIYTTFLFLLGRRCRAFKSVYTGCCDHQKTQQ